VTLQRSPRHVRVEAQGHVVDRDLSEDAVALENGNWQAYAIAAEGRSSDGTPRPVQIVVPANGAVISGTLAVDARPDGGRRVELSAANLVVTADLNAEGAVTHASVPSQGVEVLPEGTAPAPVAARPLPTGVTEEAIEVMRDGVAIRGTLWLPTGAQGHTPVAVVIAGSGPTDRDGNNAAGLRTDAYRMLCEALAARGVATVRYDKRGVGASGRNFAPERVTLDDFVDDAAALVTRLRSDPRMGSVTLVGHSEGGVIALRVAQRMPVDGLVLVATPGRTMATVLREQLARQADAATLREV